MRSYVASASPGYNTECVPAIRFASYFQDGESFFLNPRNTLSVKENSIAESNVNRLRFDYCFFNCLFWEWPNGLDTSMQRPELTLCIYCVMRKIHVRLMCKKEKRNKRRQSSLPRAVPLVFRALRHLPQGQQQSF